jgi:hypothetical protein
MHVHVPRELRQEPQKRELAAREPGDVVDEHDSRTTRPQHLGNVAARRRS